MESQPVLAGLSLSATFLVAVVEQDCEVQMRDTLSDVAGWSARSASGSRTTG